MFTKLISIKTKQIKIFRINLMKLLQHKFEGQVRHLLKSSCISRSQFVVASSLISDQLFNNNKHTFNYRHFSTNSYVSKKHFINLWSRKYLFIGLGSTVLLASAVYQIAVEYNENDDVIKENDVNNKESLPFNDKVPKSSDDIPDSVGYAIIGGGVAAFSASRTIRSKDAFARILILSEEPYFPYTKSPLTKELFINDNRQLADNQKFVQWNGVAKKLYFEKDEFYLSCKDLSVYETGGIAVAKGWSAISIDAHKRIITLEDGKTIKYKKCLLATGSSPIKLPIHEKLPISVQNKVTYYSKLADFNKIENLISNGAKSVAIFGNGYLSCELASAIAIKYQNLNVFQLNPNDNIMDAMLPPYVSKWLMQKFEEVRVKFIKKTFIEDLALTNEGKLDIKLSNGETLEVDHLLVNLGFKPNTSIAETSDLEVDLNNGGFIVNLELEARSDLYAAGDCASFYDTVLNKRRNLLYHDHAVVSGRLAGENMTGAKKSINYQPIFWCDFAEKYGFQGIGDIDSNLETVSIFSLENGENTDNLMQEYPRGVIFYLNNEIIVGILLINLFNRLTIARQVLDEKKKFTDVNEVAKLFYIHQNE